MRISVAAIGRLRGGPELDLINDYATRIRATGRPLGVTAFDIRELEAPKGLAGPKRRERESALLLQASNEASRRVALDEGGQSLSSEAFAEKLRAWRDDGAAEITYFIGGADGHDRALLERTDFVFAFGKATFPHMLVRAMLVEQIYRAMTILAGHPYHRG